MLLRLRRIKWYLPVVVLAVVFFFLAGIWLLRPKWTEERVRQVVLTTIQEETPASFYITGYLDLTTTISAQSTRYLMPDLLNLSLGTTRATARVPGRVSYGFDVRSLRPEHIHFMDDGVIEVRLPGLDVYSVEPRLEEMEIETQVGWARMYANSGREQEQRALRHVREAMHVQGRRHLETSSQPRINTAEGIRLMLAPVFEAAGMRDPTFRFHIGPDLIMEPEGTGR